MIISREHKFIYFKSYKTASTSIEIFLYAYCNHPDDIITRIGASVVKPPWYKPRNFKGYQNHSMVHEINPRLFDGYFIFTSVRHPVDKMLSLFHVKRGKDFNNFIDNFNFGDPRKAFMYPFYSLGNKVVANDMIRYETLRGDLRRVCDTLGLKYDDKYLLHCRKSERRQVDIHDWTVGKIEKEFARDYDTLGYGGFEQVNGYIHAC